MLRRSAQFFVLILIAALSLLAWSPSADTRQIRVIGPSMAPTLLGDHDAWLCAECRFPFATGAESVEIGEHPAVCPNCGRFQPEEAQPQRKPGDQLLIDMLEARAGKPMLRWETIVFRCPESAEQHKAEPHCIKRVVGLPGETVELRGGDVWINGALARKTLAQQQTMAMVVHDSRFVPNAMRGTPLRWKGAEANTGWLAGEAGSFTFSGTSPRRRLGSSPGHPLEVDWLEYTHWRRSPEDPTRFEPAAIMDDYAYNRGESRRLHRLNDLMLRGSIKAFGPGMLAFRGSVDGHTYDVLLEPQHGRGRMLCDGVPVDGVNFDMKRPLLASSSQVEFSLVDHQVLLVIDGRLLVSHACPAEKISEKSVAADIAPPFAIGASDLSVTITSLTLLRDVYYIAPAEAKAVTLGQEEYYVLGDNSPLSADSRTGWPGPGLAARQILGTLQGP
ncbi:MAG: S26 family signal peptidase [Planctomycetes bacterium]|nr:S26 family signal peptidase [Planctomycetota bacterium]